MTSLFDNDKFCAKDFLKYNQWDEFHTFYPHGTLWHTTQFDKEQESIQ